MSALDCDPRQTEMGHSESGDEKKLRRGRRSCAVSDYRYEAKKAATTHTAYQSWLNRYECHLVENGFPEPDLECALSTTNLRRYQYALDALGLRPRTIRAAFDAPRGLCEFLIHEADVTSENPVKKLTMPKKDDAVRLLVSDTEAMALLEAAKRHLDPTRIAMSTALISALLCTEAVG